MDSRMDCLTRSRSPHPQLARREQERSAREKNKSESGQMRLLLRALRSSAFLTQPSHATGKIDHNTYSTDHSSCETVHCCHKSHKW